MDFTVMPGGHMTAEWIAEYLDGGLSPDERDRFERHLNACAQCRHDLAEASDLVRSRRGRWAGALVPLAAAAAGLVIFYAAGLQTTSGTGADVVRGPGTAIQLDVVSPSEGDVLPTDSLVFTWREAGPQAHYVFTLTDADGDVVFTLGQPDTVLVLPRSVGLETGEQYYWVVDALLEGARSTSSGFHGFRIE